jgi:hypothetical protein
MSKSRSARPDLLAKRYRDLQLEVRYRHAPDGGGATATIAVANECVRGGIEHAFHPCTS